MESGTIVKFKNSNILREVVKIDENTVIMDTIDENKIRKILSSNNFNHRKVVSRDYFDLSVKNGKIIVV